MRSAVAILLILVSSAALASPGGGGSGGGGGGGGGSHGGGGGGGGGHASAGAAHSGGASRGAASEAVHVGLSHGGMGGLGTHIALGPRAAASTVADRDRTVAPTRPNLSWWRHRHDHGWLASNAPMPWPPMCSEGQRLLNHCGDQPRSASARH